MKYRELEYSRTFNRGNYESEKISLTTELDETEDLDEAFKTAKARVFHLFEEGQLLEESKIVVEADKQSEKPVSPVTEPTVAIKEETFTNLLGWEKSQGTWLGEFEFTSRKANNNSDAFNHAFNILKANNATISSRFHGKDFRHGYWLYEQKPDSLYRQILKPE